MQRIKDLADKRALEFIQRIKNVYSIDVIDDWNEFSGIEFFCIHEFVNKPRKGEVCGKKIKSGQFCLVHKKIEKKKEEVNYVSIHPKIGKYIHKTTKFAFFSKELKVVYGKLSFYDTIIPLCDKDIELCKKHRFKYDLELVKQCI